MSVVWNATSRLTPPLHAVTVVVTPPAVEPVSLAEVKQRLRITSTADDADLTRLIIAARLQLEKDLGASLVATVWETWFDRQPWGIELELPRWPLQGVTSVTSYNQDDVAAVFASGDYLVDTGTRPGRLVLNADASWPTALRARRAVAVRYTAGFSGAAKTVSSLTRTGTTATATTAAAHGWTTGKRVTVAGADQADYNGTFEITVTGATTFTFTVANAPATPATGALTATDLGVPETYALAILTLVGHWWDRLRTGMTVSGEETELPFGYSRLLSDAPVVLA